MSVFYFMIACTFFVRLGNVHDGQYDEYDSEDTHSDEQCRVSITDTCILADGTDQITTQYRNDRSRNRIQRTTELDQLITLFTTTCKCIQQRVYYRIQHTH